MLDCPLCKTKRELPFIVGDDGPGRTMKKLAAATRPLWEFDDPICGRCYSQLYDAAVKQMGNSPS